MIINVITAVATQSVTLNVPRPVYQVTALIGTGKGQNVSWGSAVFYADGIASTFTVLVPGMKSSSNLILTLLSSGASVYDRIDKTNGQFTINWFLPPLIGSQIAFDYAVKL